MVAKTRKKAISRGKALKNFKGLMGPATKVIAARFGKDFAVEVEKTTLKEFEALIPRIPYIGGRKNMLSDMPVRSGVILALYRALEKKGVPLVEFGKILEEITTAYMNRYPAPVRKMAGKLWMSAFFRRQLMKQANMSQKRNYDEDFVYEIIPGDGKYKWGIDYTECGIVKFFKKQDEEELAKYACILDYLMFPAIGVELKRSGTIAEGCRRCDFRFR